MDRPRRAFQAGALSLDGRVLPATAPLTAAVAAPFVGFTHVRQQVAQQAGEATVYLQRMNPTGTLQVHVATDPSSPAVGVNVAAVDQTVTFADGQSRAVLSVPILAGAPNPGEVDVTLSVTPIDPSPNLPAWGSIELRIMASDAAIPPTIVAEDGTPNGIELTFNRPMNPIQASNVHNYAVHATSSSLNSAEIVGDSLIGRYPSTNPYSASSALVPLRSAQYDPASLSVTLIPKRPLTYSAMTSVTQGSQGEALVPAQAWAKPRPRAH